MRVIGGEFRSRRLKSVEGMDVRPTPDRMRETLFNILAPEIEGAVFVDAFAGTGAVGIEALSRGARRVIFIEKNRAAAEVIAANLASLQAAARAQIVRGSVKLYLAAQAADMVFLDPPYDALAEYQSALAILGAGEVPLAIAQHARGVELAAEYGALRRVRELRQGDNVLAFYRTA